jgi:hypothetical protein
MKYISLLQFLNIFSRTEPPPTFSEWIKTAHVRSDKKIVSLEAYQKARGITRENLKMIYDHILNKEDYLTRFYKISLDPCKITQVNRSKCSLSSPDISILDAPMPRANLNNNAKVQYKNVIRNLHIRDILQRTKSGWSGLPSFLDVLLDLYKRNIIDYKILTPSALHYIKGGRIGSVFSSFYFRASIMNPYLVFSLNENVLQGTRIFTPTLGWSSYAYGFAESPRTLEYVGCDVIPGVCQKTANLLELYPRIKTDFYCQPSETLSTNKSFMTKYKNHFDIVFFSPPYYELEMYPGENQSTSTYKNYNEWLVGYWAKTIDICHYVLQKGGKLCYILSSGGGENTSADILKDMNDITKKRFQWKTTLPMYNKNVHVTASSHRETAEKIVIFMKV